MAEWKKKASLISGDVVFFEYVTSKLSHESELVYIWDLDKTYLDTHFDSLGGLIKTALEKAFQKKNVPGTGSLVRALTSSRGKETDSQKPFPIYFITASPPQMEKKISSKLILDGISPYGAFFKDNLKNLRPKLWSRLNKQVGYKVQALLELRTRLNEKVKQVLWGDDSEQDAIIYSLYSDICSRRLPADDIRYILSKLFVTYPQIERILELQEAVPASDPVEKIYINLASDTDPEYYSKFGRRLISTFNTFQVALDLYQDARLTDTQVLKVAQDMATNYGFTEEELSLAISDLVARLPVSDSTLDVLIPLLKQNSLLPQRYVRPNNQRRKRNLGPNGLDDRLIPSRIDYLNDFR